MQDQEELQIDYAVLVQTLQERLGRKENELVMAEVVASEYKKQRDEARQQIAHLVDKLKEEGIGTENIEEGSSPGDAGGDDHRKEHGGAGGSPERPGRGAVGKRS